MKREFEIFFWNARCTKYETPRHFIAYEFQKNKEDFVCLFETRILSAMSEDIFIAKLDEKQRISILKYRTVPDFMNRISC